MIAETVMNANIVMAVVEDWASNVLASFEGESSSWDAIEWREVKAKEWANGDEEEEEGYLEDLYVIGYDVDGNEVGVQFG